MLKAGSLNYSIVNERVAGYLIYICFLNKKISRLKFIIKLSALKNVFMLRLTRKKKEKMNEVAENITAKFLRAFSRVMCIRISNSGRTE